MDRGALGVLMHIARLWGVAPFSRGTYEISKPFLFYGYTLIFVLGNLCYFNVSSISLAIFGFPVMENNEVKSS